MNKDDEPSWRAKLRYLVKGAPHSIEHREALERECMESLLDVNAVMQRPVVGGIQVELEFASLAPLDGESLEPYVREQLLAPALRASAPDHDCQIQLLQEQVR